MLDTSDNTNLSSYFNCRKVYVFAKRNGLLFKYFHILFSIISYCHHAMFDLFHLCSYITCLLSQPRNIEVVSLSVYLLVRTMTS